MQLAEIVRIILLILLIGCAVAVNLTPSLLQAVIIFMSYSSIMCVLWVLMESEAAVGAGISGILFMVTLKKIRREDEAEPGEVGDVPLEELLLREEFKGVRETVLGHTDLRGRRMEKFHKRNREARKTAQTGPSKTESALMDLSSDNPEQAKSSRTPKKKGGAKSRGKRGRR